MQVSVILAHPEPTSFNHAIARKVLETLASEDVRVNFHDLYQEQFEPLLPAEEVARDVDLPPLVAAHCREISEADLIIVIHPNWWGQPPAILKGWIDRVIRPGVAYEFLDGDSGEGVPVGLLQAKLALVFNTSNTEGLREHQVFGDPLETIWKNCIFGLCGVADVRRETFAIVITSSEEQRRSWLAEVRQQVEEACSLISEG
ncbi:MAG: NAD(P)H-dependent oxidoreductase [Desulfocapsaceae bacterium]